MILTPFNLLDFFLQLNEYFVLHDCIIELLAKTILWNQIS